MRLFTPQGLYPKAHSQRNATLGNGVCVTAPTLKWFHNTALTLHDATTQRHFRTAPASIPHGSLIVLDSLFPQQPPKLILECVAVAGESGFVNPPSQQ